MSTRMAFDIADDMGLILTPRDYCEMLHHQVCGGCGNCLECVGCDGSEGFQDG